MILLYLFGVFLIHLYILTNNILKSYLKPTGPSQIKPNLAGFVLRQNLDRYKGLLVTLALEVGIRVYTHFIGVKLVVRSGRP
jgi:hypothetical protein